jgi:hypothetical protein
MKSGEIIASAPSAEVLTKLRDAGLGHLLVEQDVLARMEIDMLKNRVKALEEVALEQEARIRRLLRLVGALR